MREGWRERDIIRGHLRSCLMQIFESCPNRQRQRLGINLEISKLLILFPKDERYEDEHIGEKN